MQLSDKAAAWIRTVWPMLLGAIAAWLLGQSWTPTITGWLAELGIEVTEPRLTAVLGVVLGAAVYSAGRWLERRTGQGRWVRLARGVGKFLLSVGLPTGQPVYAMPGQRVRVLGSDGSIRTPR